MRDGGTPQEVSFQFVPTVKGRHTLRGTDPAVPEEKITENNQRTAVAQVVDSKIRVLYIEGTLRAEYGALVQRFLSKDPDLEFCALVQIAPERLRQADQHGGAEARRAARRCGRVGEVRRDPAGRPRQLVLEAPGDGAAGRSGCATGPACWRSAATTAWGPAVTGARRSRRSCRSWREIATWARSPTPFLPVLTPAGRDHPIFANIGKFFPTPRAPPQVAGPAAAGRLRPGDRRPARGPGPGDPSGEGRQDARSWPSSPWARGAAAVFTGDTTRNWQQVPRALDQESPFLRFWGQMIRWLANRTAGREGRGRHHGPDRQGLLRARLADHRLRRRPRSGGGEGPTRPRSPRRSRRPEGTTDAVALSPIAGSAGSYQGTFEPKRPGTYEISVEATAGIETLLRAERTTAEVGRPNLEFDRLDLDDATLARIAGGDRRTLLAHQHGRPVDRRARPQGEAPARLARAAAVLPRRLLGPLRRRPGGGVGPPQEVSTAMSRDRGYRYLDPAALARVKNLSLVARGVVEGFITGLHAQSLQGIQRRVRRAPQVQPRRQHPPPRLADPRPHRPAVYQAIRRGDQPSRPDPPGHERLDGLRRAPRDHEARIRLLPDGRAGLLDDAGSRTPWA